MRILLSLILLAIGTTAFAQDDMPDFRSKKDNFSKMQEKEIRADLSRFTLAGIDEGVGKEPLKSLPITSNTSNAVVFEGNDIKVEVKTAAFDPSKHKIGYSDKYVVKIDNKPFFGNYGAMPRKIIQSVTVTMGGDTVVIPPTAFVDLYEPILAYDSNNKSQNGVYVSPDGHKLYIYMLNREQVGNYEVTWVIQDKKYLRRTVDTGLLK
ncbi:MAG: hypothetical protein J0I41_22080 [Filimonas sp.]|nr:hypothetical protein [Filimonas sp.]